MNLRIVAIILLVVLFAYLIVTKLRKKNKSFRSTEEAGTDEAAPAAENLEAPTDDHTVDGKNAAEPESAEISGYFEAERPEGDGLCSDNACPCPQVVIPRGGGYLYISKECVEFHRDARTLVELAKKIQSTYRPNFDAQARQALQNGFSSFQMFLPPGVANPIFMCEQGAKLRKLNLEIAAEDARYWWETGKVPLRATPLSNEERSERAE